MPVRILFVLAFVLGALGLPVSSGWAQEPLTIEPGKAIEREIAAGQTHSYRITLAAGQFIRVLVEQPGCDVALTLVAPDGKTAVESKLNRPNALESLSFEAQTGGEHLLQIRPFKLTDNYPSPGAYQVQVSDNRGAYRIRLETRATATAQDRQRIEAERLLAEAYRMGKQPTATPQQKEEKAQQALTLWRALGDKYWEATTLSLIATAHFAANSHDKAAEWYTQALAVWRALGDRINEARTLNDLGWAYQRARNFPKATECYEQALKLAREIKDRLTEAHSLSNLAGVDEALNRRERAIEYVKQALPLCHEVGDQQYEARLLLRQARHYGYPAAYARYNVVAEEFFQRALSLAREIKERGIEAQVLSDLGWYYFRIKHYEQGRARAEQALAIHREDKNKRAEATMLNLLGTISGSLGQYEKSVTHFEQGLVIHREVKNKTGEAHILSDLGYTHFLLGQYEKSLDCYRQSLALIQEFKDQLSEAVVLSNIGEVFLKLGQLGKAREYLEQSRLVRREVRQTEFVPTLNLLGEVYRQQRQYEQARNYYDQALALSRTVRDRQSEADSLLHLALLYSDQRQYTKAQESLVQSLSLTRQIKERFNEGLALHQLMQVNISLTRPSLAIFYGKQSVNTWQEMRSDIRGLEKEAQQSFLKSREDTYRQLADLLISQGRLPEAEQVIRMLKEEEYFEYIRRDQQNSSKAEKAALTPEEAALDKRYREIADKLTEIGSERGALLDKPSRTPAEEQRLAQLEADLIVAGQAFQKFLDRMAEELGNAKEASSKVYQLREAQGLMEDLRELGKGVVALYTLVGEEKYRVILTTADFQRGYEYPIKAEALNRKALAFREALQNPRLDPLPLAQELYKILVGPVAKDLQGAKAQMVMWSLDGVLRYVPVAALHDGKQYLVERYRTAVFTPASQSRLRAEPSRKWTALGLGVTKAHGPTIPALPGVLEEMRGIIQESGQEAGTKTGVLPGSIKLDEAFTQEAMLTELRKRNPVVHVASHFQFKPGNETDSALLLGDGQFLSLAQIKSLPNVFSGVELLTLSACNTATGGSGANGKEVEGFGVLAQRQGAKAVVASLWPVADRSTKILMQDFYRLREAKQGEAKSEALRQAQIRLLHGEYPFEAATLASNRQIVHEEKTSGAANRPLFKPDPKKPYAHPYYWAPFILIGNWK